MSSLNTLINRIKNESPLNSNIQAIYLGGSTGRGLNDSMSDLDFCILWKSIPSYEERTSFFEKIGLNGLDLSVDSLDSDNLADHGRFDRFNIDINSLSLDSILILAQNFRYLPKLTLDLHELAYALQTGTVIYGEEVLNPIREQIGKPTDTQRFSAIDDMLKADWTIELIKSNRRCDWPAYYKLLSASYHDLFRVACLCEYRFYPGPKRHQEYQKGFRRDWTIELSDLWVQTPENQISAISLTVHQFKKFLAQGMI